uniref:Uncharacterized protein n=1 Tax=viral metagenome TaxID=1070528 RepID=A0A6C0EBB7_9ZZZZ
MFQVAKRLVLFGAGLAGTYNVFVVGGIMTGSLDPQFATSTTIYRHSDTLKKAIIKTYGLSNATYTDKQNFELCKYAISLEKSNISHVEPYNWTEEQCKEFGAIVLLTQPYDYLVDMRILKPSVRFRFLANYIGDYYPLLLHKRNFDYLTKDEWKFLLKYDPNVINYVKKLDPDLISVSDFTEEEVAEAEKLKSKM